MNRLYLLARAVLLCVAVTGCLGSSSSGDADAPDAAEQLPDAPDAADAPELGDAPGPTDLVAAAKDARAPLCRLEAPTTCPDPPLRYGDVAPIIERRCHACHNAASGLWALVEYRHVVDWQDTIRGAMLTCIMPPGESNMPMTVEERMALLIWIRCGSLP